MINFFRKTRKKLADDNRPLKYMRYAIGEIVLVVIGILIALSINNWNEWRKDRIIEKSVLIELRDNLDRNIAIIDNATTEIIRVNQICTTIIEIIEEKKSYPDTLINYFNLLDRSGSYLFKVNRNGYESLKNIGFEILSSKELKNEVLSLFEISYTTYEQSRNLITSKWAANPMWWQDYFFIRPTKSGLIPLDYNSLKEDKNFMTIVRDFERGRHFILEEMKTCKIESLKVLKSIEDELTKQKE